MPGPFRQTSAGAGGSDRLRRPDTAPHKSRETVDHDHQPHRARRPASAAAGRAQCMRLLRPAGVDLFDEDPVTDHRGLLRRHAGRGDGATLERVRRYTDPSGMMLSDTDGSVGCRFWMGCAWHSGRNRSVVPVYCECRRRRCESRSGIATSSQFASDARVAPKIQYQRITPAIGRGLI